jgi:hypothetical protein
MLLAEWMVRLVAAYAALGVGFALWFGWAGAARMDPAARGAGLGFRLLILPGAAALWPLLLARSLRGQSAPPAERNAHRRRP